MHKYYGFELIENDTCKKSFKTTCESSNKDKDVNVVLKYDKTKKQVVMVFHVLTSLKYYGNNIFQKFLYKLNLIKGVLIDDEISLNADFIFRGQNHISDFSDFLHILSKDCKKEFNLLEQTQKELRILKNKYNKKGI